ncbi:hypothetical protein DWQ65_10920 [Treponema phagedenis]|uniref:hypothetical protein n=1 Tax=Treponema phagedenis TaxID=162 RepID=UPI0001F63E6A|nr:hypothetical protein [Treponema phagedenis]EFW38019.1 hypothetical protein HMPREF9554_01478 [Treponema phagedenis F0421]QSI00559.1 hypothetical protein DWQ65_10920 [Treponema phagedenis]TYT78401.1 hypothetical protein FS559_04350 [Treponema phagedenis]
MVTTSKELGEAVKAGEDKIEISADLEHKIIRMKATGNVAWAIAIGAIAIAVTGIILSSTGVGAPEGAPLAFVAAPVAVGVLGVDTTAMLISVAVAAGGIGAITKLRSNYKVEKKDGKIFLIKK